MEIEFSNPVEIIHGCEVILFRCGFYPYNSGVIKFSQIQFERKISYKDFVLLFIIYNAWSIGVQYYEINFPIFN